GSKRDSKNDSFKITKNTKEDNMPKYTTTPKGQHRSNDFKRTSAKLTRATKIKAKVNN
ncbi:2297_t:CDS:1, partial [Gigaspora rosea]